MAMGVNSSLQEARTDPETVFRPIKEGALV